MHVQPDLSLLLFVVGLFLVAAFLLGLLAALVSLLSVRLGLLLLLLLAGLGVGHLQINSPLEDQSQNQQSTTLPNKVKRAIDPNMSIRSNELNAKEVVPGLGSVAR